eukprot:5589608-Pyramimonas_sp.AAC.1
MSSRIVSIPSTMAPLFAARANSWRSPNVPGSSDSAVPCKPLGRLCPHQIVPRQGREDVHAPAGLFLSDGVLLEEPGRRAL